MTDVASILRAQFQSGLDVLAAEIAREIEAQGHNASGALIRSIETEIKSTVNFHFEGFLKMNDYAGILNDGVRASRIPYTAGGPRRGGRSKYIEGLMRWAEIVRPSLSEKERKGFVFAVAATHAREGMPTRGSYFYSQNGRRLGLLEQDRYADAVLGQFDADALLDVLSFAVTRVVA